MDSKERIREAIVLRGPWLKPDFAGRFCLSDVLAEFIEPTPAEVRHALDDLVSEGALKRWGTSLEPLPTGWKLRESLVRQLGWRHSSLMPDSGIDLDELMLAVVMTPPISVRRGQGMFAQIGRLPSRVLTIYFPQHDEKILTSTRANLVKMGLVESRVDKDRGYLDWMLCATGLGVRAYRRRLAKFGLVEGETILDERSAPSGDSKQADDHLGNDQRPMSEASSSIGAAVDFVIITALEEERDAVLTKLPGWRKLDKLAGDVRTYYEAHVSTRRVDASSYRIIVTCICDAGPQLATAVAGGIVGRWHPKQVLLVGIACGLPAETKHGDVLLAKQVADYTLGKIWPDGKREIRWEVHRAGANLLDSAMNLAVSEWFDLIAVHRPETGEPTRRSGVIASGGDVISNDEVISEYKAAWGKLIGIEMEAGGTATGLHQTSDPPEFLMIKAVSDHGKDKHDQAVIPWRAYACDVAAAFAVGLIRSGPRQPATRVSSPVLEVVRGQQVDMGGSSREAGLGPGDRAASAGEVDSWRAGKRDSKRAEIAGETLVATLRFLDGLGAVISILVRTHRETEGGDDRAAFREEVKSRWDQFATISTRFIEAKHLAEAYLPEEVNDLLERVWQEHASVKASQMTYFATPGRAAAEFFREGFGSVPEKKLVALRDKCRKALRPIAQLSDGSGDLTMPMMPAREMAKRIPDIEIVPKGTSAGSVGFDVRWALRNVSDYTCKIKDISFRFETTEAYARHVRDKGLLFNGILVIDYHSPHKHPIRSLMSGERAEYGLNVSDDLARELLRQAHAPFAEGWSPDWITVHIRVFAVGPDGDPAEFENHVMLC